MTGVEDKVQQLDVRYEKCIYLHQNYRRSKLKINVPCSQWLPKPSHQVQGHYDDIERKQVMNVLHGASRHVYGHQNTACTTRIRLKRRHCAIPVFSFFRSAFFPMLHVKRKRSNGRRADNPHGCKRRRTVKTDADALQTCPFLDQLTLIWFCGFAGKISQSFCPLGRKSWESIVIPHVV